MSRTAIGFQPVDGVATWEGREGRETNEAMDDGGFVMCWRLRLSVFLTA